ncbi:glycosyltransferase family 4 protein [Thermodesulfobacteriota bacterium]
MSMRRIIIIAYFFPPILESGTFRILKLIKYLPRFGYSSTVVAPGRTGAAEAGYAERFAYDPRGVRRAPDTTAHGLSEFLRARRRARRKTDAGSAAGGEPPRRGSLPGRLRKFAKTWLFMPDAYISWLPMALITALRACRASGGDIILSTSNPISIHLTALLLKRVTGKPWIADFRDLFAGNPYRDYNSPLRDRIDGIIERMVLKRADLVTVVSEPLREAILEHNIAELAEKVHVLPNGFDPDSLRKEEEEGFDTFTIAYTGTFYQGKRDPKGVLEAISRLIDCGKVDPDRLRFRIAAPIDDYALSLREKYPLDGVVQWLGIIPPEESIALQRASSLLVLIIWDSVETRGEFSAKLFEYMAARRPILAIVPPGDVAARAIEETGTGMVIDPRDERGIERAIADRYRLFYKAGGAESLPGTEALEPYSWATRLEELCRVIDRYELP